MSDHQVESSERAALRRRTAENERSPAAGRDDVHPLLRLQGQVGNGNIARLLAQRADDDEIQAKHDLAQRAEDDDIQAKHETVGVEGGQVGPDTASRIDASRGSGSALDDGTRTGMESAFGTSFADVRVHTDAESDTLNRRLTARAFTTGSDVFLRRDASPTDSRLMAHELTHVVQQRSMGGGGPMQVGAAGDSHEQHADAAADIAARASAGRAEEVQAQHDLAQRAEDDEIQATHDFAQREEDDDIQASHDLAQREEDDDIQATHDLAQREEDDDVQATHDLAQREEDDDIQAKHDLAQREEDDDIQATHDVTQRESEDGSPD